MITWNESRSSSETSSQACSKTCSEASSEASSETCSETCSETYSKSPSKSVSSRKKRTYTQKEISISNIVFYNCQVIIILSNYKEPTNQMKW